MFQEDLLFLFSVDFDERKVLGTSFSDWVVSSIPRALQLFSSIVTNPTFVGVSARKTVMNPHSRCVSGSIVASLHNVLSLYPCPLEENIFTLWYIHYG